ncbi:MAG: hypothetical protein ACJ741_11145 [Pyrinomonadaceae bacterium]
MKETVVGEVAQANRVASLREWDALVREAEAAGRRDLVDRWGKCDRENFSWTEVDGRARELRKELAMSKGIRNGDTIIGKDGHYFTVESHEGGEIKARRQDHTNATVETFSDGELMCVDADDGLWQQVEG